MQGTFDLPPETAQEVKKAVKRIRLGIHNTGSTLPKTVSDKDRRLCNDAMWLDRTYAAKVCGHSNKDSITQGWVSQNPNSTELDQTLFTTLVSEIVERTSRDLFSAQLYDEDDATAIKKMSEIGKSIKAVSMHVRIAWEEFDNYHVSPCFRAAEDCIVQDLIGRGFFGWLDLTVTIDASVDKDLRRRRESLIFVLRRCTALNHAFARTVGAHLLTQQLITVNRGSMMEHRRSYNIFENAFNALCVLIGQHDEDIMELVNCKTLNVLTIDYYEALAEEYLGKIYYKMDDGISVPATVVEDGDEDGEDISHDSSSKRRKPRSIWTTS